MSLFKVLLGVDSFCRAYVNKKHLEITKGLKKGFKRRKIINKPIAKKVTAFPGPEIENRTGVHLLQNKLNKTPAKNGKFSAKIVTHQHVFEPTTSCMPGRRTIK